MSSQSSLARELARVSRDIDGNVIDAESPAFDRLTKPFNARFDELSPRAVVLCTSPNGVAATVSCVRGLGVEVAIRSGGHCFAGRSSSSGVVIDVGPMNSVILADGAVRVGAGARLGEVYLAMLEKGLVIPGGSCPSVGIAGLTLGGGLGMLGRRYGVASDHLVGATIVLADGRIVECDEHHYHDLFWALRGAGAGHFGVVTEFVFRPIPAPAVTTFRLDWRFSAAAKVIQAWTEWLHDLPDEIAPSLVVTADANPEHLPGLEVFGISTSGSSETRALLESLVNRAKEDPARTEVLELSYREALDLWAKRAGEDLQSPRALNTARSYHAIKSEFFARSLPSEVVAALVSGLAEDRQRGQTRELDFTPWGGAYNRSRSDATAFAHRNELFMLKHTASVDVESTAEDRISARKWADDSWHRVHECGTGGVFPNFADPDLENWGHCYYGQNFDRLLGLKAKYDPGSVFRGSQSLLV